MTPPRYFNVLLGMTVVMTALLHTADASNPAFPDTAPRAAITPQAGVDRRQDNPQSLLSLAESLVSQYYPSTKISNLADLTIPPTIVIGGQTIVNSPAKTSDPLASITGGASNSGPSGMTTRTSPSNSNGASETSNNGASQTNSDGSQASQTNGVSGSNTDGTASSTDGNGASSTNGNGASSTTGSGGSSTGTSSGDQSGTTTNKHHGLSAGKIAGIVIGTILAVVLFALLLFFCLKLRQRRSKKKASKISKHDGEVGNHYHQTEPHNIPPPHTMNDNHQHGYGPEMVAAPNHHNGLTHNAHHDPYNNMNGQNANPFSSQQDAVHGDHPHGLHSNGHGSGHHGMGTAAGAGLVGAGAGALAARHHHNNHSHSHSNSSGHIPRRPVGNGMNHNHSPPRQKMAPLPIPVNPSHNYDSHNRPHNGQRYSNEHYGEGRDMVSPIVPVRSNEQRRHSPRHAPTRNEMNDFDFNDQGRNPAFSPHHQQQPQQQSWKHSYDDQNGWRQTEGHGRTEPVRQSFNYRDDGHGWQEGGLHARQPMQ